MFRAAGLISGFYQFGITAPTHEPFDLYVALWHFHFTYYSSPLPRNPNQKLWNKRELTTFFLTRKLYKCQDGTATPIYFKLNFSCFHINIFNFLKTTKAPHINKLSLQSKVYDIPNITICVLTIKYMLNYMLLGKDMRKKKLWTTAIKISSQHFIQS